MKATLVFLLVVAAMCAAEAGPMKKRFLLKEIQNAINLFINTYNSAKDSFNKLVSGSTSDYVDYDQAVNALIPLINTDMTMTACVNTCEDAAASVLGPAADLASNACTPVCDGALAKLEDAAG